MHLSTSVMRRCESLTVQNSTVQTCAPCLTFLLNAKHANQALNKTKPALAGFVLFNVNNLRYSFLIKTFAII